MSASLSPFSRWALDDGRTADEKYLIFLVCEACRLLEHLREPLEVQRRTVYRHALSYEYQQKLYLNPLLMPEFTEVDTERAAAMAPYLKKFEPLLGHENRRIGDAGKVLSFFPALETLALGSTRLKDLSFLRSLPNLRTLLIGSGEMEDIEPMSHCPQIEALTLFFSGSGIPNFAPPLYWLNGRPLGALQQLKKLTIHPNPAILSGLSFPELHTAEFAGGNVMQPDCAFLPEMPKLRVLTLTGVQSLRGISRFSELRHLKIDGALRDWGDIGELRHLDCLEVETLDGWPRDVTPLTALPNLLYARFAGEIPRNYWPLSQCPRLCELSVAAPSVQMEAAAINAALPGWDGVFGTAEPRALPPLRFVCVDAGGDQSVLPKGPDAPCAESVAHPLRFCLEVIWMNQRAWDAVVKVTGQEESVGRHHSPSRAVCWERNVTISLETIEAVQKFPEILDALRGVMAGSPHPWVFRVTIMLRLTKLQMTPQQIKWLKQIEENPSRWDDDLDLERWKQKQKHVMETQFKLRQTEEEGEEPDPEDFAPPPLIRPDDYGRRALTPSGKGTGGEEEENPDFELKPFDQQEQNDDGDDDDDSSVKTAPPPDPPPSFLDDPYEHPLADSYRIFAQLTFDTFYCHGNNNATAIQLMRREPDEYFPKLTSNG